MDAYRDWRGSYSYEFLPYPHVLYPALGGTFIGFKKSLADAHWSLCSCTRFAISALFKYGVGRNCHQITGLWSDAIFSCYDFPYELLESYGGACGEVDTIDDVFSFVHGICHRCNRAVPHRSHTARMYCTELEHRLGWYANLTFLEWGILEDGHTISPRLLPEVAWPIWVPEWGIESGEAWGFFKREFIHHQCLDIQDQLDYKAARKLVLTKVKADFHLKEKKTHINEQIMAMSVAQIFGGQRLYRNTRPSWLDGMELDVFIPSAKLAFEYQGVQHFKPVKAWGGEAALKSQKKRDRLKRKICKSEGIRLIRISHKDFVSPLTIFNMVMPSALVNAWQKRRCRL